MSLCARSASSSFTAAKARVDFSRALPASSPSSPSSILGLSLTRTPRPSHAPPRRYLRSLADLSKMSSSSTIVPPAVPTADENFPSSGPSTSSFILTLSCPDRKGIVHAVTGFLAQRGFNIRDSAQFGDSTTKRFFMRVHAESDEPFPFSSSKLKDDFVKETKIDPLDFEFHNDQEKPKTLIMVSKIGHCLNDLLFRVSSGTLPIEVPLIISNHNEYAALAKSHGIPFYHLPIDVKAGKTKEWQEEEIVKLASQYSIDLVVLARYMQILSPKLCSLMSGRIINIHHSFLPSFKGAKPYHQAYERGIKLIGATAHYVTADLDEGPIIEQAVERVDHAYTPLELTKAGADVEARVLAKAVRWHAERRILSNGAKTVVFS